MREEKPMTIQNVLLEAIQEVIPPNQSLVNELSDLLGVSIDSAYRRLRGETALTIGEIETICNRYNLSFDSFLATELKTVTFNYKLLNNIDSFVEYLNDILSHLKVLAESDDAHVIYSAVDIPIFHHFAFPELAAFKIFYWLRSVANVPELADKKFDPNLLSEDLTKLAHEVYSHYMRVPSSEIWTEETINSNLKQLEFYWDSGAFTSAKDALRICDCYEEEFKTLQKHAQHSSKIFVNDIVRPGSEDSFKFYISDIEIGNNCIYVTRGDLATTYLSLHTFNKMVTSNQRFCKETETWLNNMIKKSTLMSGVGEKQRFQFFKKAFDKIERLRYKIENE